MLFSNKVAYRCPVIEHVTGPQAVNSSKKYGPRIKTAVNPHHTVTFGDCNGTCKIERRFSGCQIRQLLYSPNRTNKSALHLSRGYSKAILNQLQGEQEIEVRKGVDSRNHVEVIPAQAEACTDNTVGYAL